MRAKELSFLGMALLAIGIVGLVLLGSQGNTLGLSSGTPAARGKWIFEREPIRMGARFLILAA